jgi:hypothetical protein
MRERLPAGTAARTFFVDAHVPWLRREKPFAMETLGLPPG